MAYTTRHGHRNSANDGSISDKSENINNEWTGGAEPAWRHQQTSGIYQQPATAYGQPKMKRQTGSNERAWAAWWVMDDRMKNMTALAAARRASGISFLWRINNSSKHQRAHRVTTVSTPCFPGKNGRGLSMFCLRRRRSVKMMVWAGERAVAPVAVAC